MDRKGEKEKLRILLFLPNFIVENELVCAAVNWGVRKNQLQLQQLPQKAAQLLSAYTLHSHTNTSKRNTRNTNNKTNKYTIKKVAAAKVAAKRPSAALCEHVSFYKYKK